MSADQENIAVGSKHLRHIDRRWARREGASTLIGRAGSRSGNRGVGAKRGVGVGAKRRLHRKPRLLSYRTRSLQRERSFFSARTYCKVFNKALQGAQPNKARRPSLRVGGGGRTEYVGTVYELSSFSQTLGQSSIYRVGAWWRVWAGGATRRTIARR